MPWLAEPPANDSRYLREALREGLRLERSLGINPFAGGFIGSTDSHIAAPGGVEEGNYGGHHGAQNIDPSAPLSAQLVDRMEQNPGGLAVIYAEENTRESLFAGMQRREAYATSGPRIGLRFFAGADFDDGLCDSRQLLESAYRNGVPMGGELSAALPGGPEFVVSATADPEGLALQRLQVIKVWVDGDGTSREQVVDVAAANMDAGVDPSSCEPIGAGPSSLCTVWRDRDYEAGQSAVYYARVIENPSCRWHTRVCVANRVDCASPDTVPEGLRDCCSADTPRVIQERAWSSPIWLKAPE